MRGVDRNRRGGQALVTASLSLMLLFSVMGLSIDLGWAYYLKTRVQTAADAAASAAAVYAKNNGDTCGTVSCGTTYTCAGTSPPTTSLEAGCLYATSDSPPAYTATMLENNTAPPGESGNSPSMWIEATVSTTAHNLFLFWSGFQSASISAQAIAGLTTVAGGSCIYALGSGSINDALSVTGTSSITTSACGIYVNSSSASAMYEYGSPTVTSGGPINVVGGTSISGSSHVSPTPTTGAPVVADPFASVPEPTFSGCDQTNYSIGHSDVAALTHGVYCGGMSITGNSTVTLGAGVYILNGGGLTISNSATVTGAGVMFYNT